MTFIVLRVQSPEGTKRINISTDDTVSTVYDKVVEAFELSSYNFILYLNRNKKDELISSPSKKVSSYKVRHGDTLYMSPGEGNFVWESKPGPSTSDISVASTSNASSNVEDSVKTKSSNTDLVVEEDEVDKILRSMDGKIQRQRDEKLCHHNRNGCCVHCSPLEPFDEAYLKEHNVKHLSFHTYLRKIKAGDRGHVALENISCKIKSGCKVHPPWPRGICSKCQPSAVTLNRQVYRHVDNVMFENPQIVERFIDYWRATGHQRIGFLYGKYEVHSDVPLGIRATVAAIYEPPQESGRDRVRLVPDDKEALVEEVTKGLGLVRVGWIFTDLITEDAQNGTVKYLRNIDTHFLSAQECITAAHFQNLHPNPCKLSSTGYHGSKFVTICVTGDEKNQVHMVGYQVSQQGMSLVRDGCLVPTKDIPQMGYVKESSKQQYVPDVYYKEKDGYGNEVSKLARTLPVEYLLIDVPVSTPLTPLYSFNDPVHRPFPIENRLVDGHLQDFDALFPYMSQFDELNALAMASDFHLLVYLAGLEVVPLREALAPLLAAVRTRDEEAALHWAHGDQWMTIRQLAESSRGQAQAPPPSDSDSAWWTCPHCTFNNNPLVSNCDMCALPR